jgi:hypothetical protein
MGCGVSHIFFDARKMVKHFGGVTRTKRLLNEYGYDITIDGVDKWRRRNSIPFKALCTLALASKSENRRFELLEFISQSEEV